MTATYFVKHRTFDRSSFVVTRDFGPLGLESVMHPEDSRESVIFDIASGQIDRVVSVVEFNSVEGWANDITEDVQAEVEKLVSERAAA